MASQYPVPRRRPHYMLSLTQANRISSLPDGTKLRALTVHVWQSDGEHRHCRPSCVSTSARCGSTALYQGLPSAWSSHPLSHGDRHNSALLAAYASSLVRSNKNSICKQGWTKPTPISRKTVILPDDPARSLIQGHLPLSWLCLACCRKGCAATSSSQTALSDAFPVRLWFCIPYHAPAAIAACGSSQGSSAQLAQAVQS